MEDCLEILKNIVISARELRIKENKPVYNNPYVIMGKNLYESIGSQLSEYEISVDSRNITKAFKINVRDFTLSLYYTPNVSDWMYFICSIGTSSNDSTLEVYRPYFNLKPYKGDK